MVTKAQIDRLSARIEQMAVANDPAITVAVFKGETPEFAIQRHKELRPDHCGRRLSLSWRTEPRDEVGEMFAVCTLAEIAAAVEAATDQKGGRLIGAQFVEAASNCPTEGDVKC
jgi:hypothetical protein